MEFKNTTAIDDMILLRMTDAAIRFWAKHLDVPFKKKHIHGANFRNRETATSGRAWWASDRNEEECQPVARYIDSSRFCVSVGFEHWTCKENCQRWCGKSIHVGENNLRKGDHAKCGFKWRARDHLERIRQAFRLTAHEVGHLAVHYAEDFHGRKFTRNNGTSGGCDEEFIDRIAWKFVDELWPAFSVKAKAMTEKAEAKKQAAAQKAEAKIDRHKLAIAAKAAAPTPSPVEKREAKARRGVERTLEKLEKLERLRGAAEKRLKEYQRKVRYYDKRKGVK